MAAPTILMLNHNLVRRGTFFRCIQFARCLVKSGFDVTLISASDQPRLRTRRSFDHSADATHQALTIIETPRFGSVGQHDGGWAPVDIVFRLGHVLRHRYDIVHAFDHRPNVSFPWFLSRCAHKSIHVADWADWWCRGGIITSRRRFQFLDGWEAALEEGIKRAADGVTVTSRVLEQRALSLGILPEKILYLPSGADTERIKPLDRTECRKRLNIPLGARVVSFVGHALWDLDFLVNAFRIVSKADPKAMLYLVGSEWKEMKGVLSAGYSGLHIRSAGLVSPEQLPMHLAVADVHALPLQDTLVNQARGPIKLGDYMASGRPIVTQGVGDTGALVEKEAIGLVTGTTAEDFARGMATLLADPELCVQLGHR
ncbi:MAG TPA: glycosyltransferase, partial [bacterium]|nr:glycosyltransferase [bacterium]